MRKTWVGVSDSLTHSCSVCLLQFRYAVMFYESVYHICRPNCRCIWSECQCMNAAYLRVWGSEFVVAGSIFCNILGVLGVCISALAFCPKIDVAFCMKRLIF